MARYVYAGTAPEEVREDDVLTVVRPGDVREAGAPPAWGAWELLPGGAESDAAEPGDPPPAPEPENAPAADVTAPENGS